MTPRPDPFTEIREALEWIATPECGETSRRRRHIEALTASLSRLEREAAERETALLAKGTLVHALRGRVREVEAERDRLARELEDRRVWERHWQQSCALETTQREAAEATVARQAEALREIAERGSDEAGWWNADVARAVLASPEAAAAEPRQWELPLGVGGILWLAALDRVPIEERIEWVAAMKLRVAEINAHRAALAAVALPAVDAPPPTKES